MKLLRARALPLVLATSCALAIAGCSDDEDSRPAPQPSGSQRAQASAPPGPDVTKLKEQLLASSVLPESTATTTKAPPTSLEEVCGGVEVPSDAQRGEVLRQELQSKRGQLTQTVIAHAPGTGETALAELRGVLRSCTSYPTARGVVQVETLTLPDPGVATLGVVLSGASEEVLVLTHAGDVTHVLRVRATNPEERLALAKRAVDASAAKLRTGARPGAEAPQRPASEPAASPSAS